MSELFSYHRIYLLIYLVKPRARAIRTNGVFQFWIFHQGIKIQVCSSTKMKFHPITVSLCQGKNFNSDIWRHSINFNGYDKWPVWHRRRAHSCTNRTDKNPYCSSKSPYHVILTLLFVPKNMNEKEISMKKQSQINEILGTSKYVLSICSIHIHTSFIVRFGMAGFFGTLQTIISLKLIYHL